jgi:probable addiction module antidote protein
MMETKTAPYDVVEFLETPEEMAAYLEACIQESDGDAAFIAKALGNIARAKGMTPGCTRVRTVAGKSV